LNELKLRYGRISPRRARAVAAGIRHARELRARLDAEPADAGESAASEQLRGEINRYSISTVCDKRELFWARHVLNFKIGEIVRILGRYLGLTRAS
jgi:hypothetical protein